MSLGALWSGWADELPLHEASLELDPPEEERIDRAAYQLARSIKGQPADFDGKEHDPKPPQTEEEADKAAEQLNATWPRVT